jgi:hypothetical protein
MVHLNSEGDNMKKIRNQKGEISHVGSALVGYVTGFGVFTFLLLGGLASLLKAINGCY